MRFFSILRSANSSIVFSNIDITRQFATSEKKFDSIVFYILVFEFFSSFIVCFKRQKALLSQNGIDRAPYLKKQ